MLVQGRLPRTAAAVLALSAFALLGADSPPSRFTSKLHVTGMTFVSSRGSASELVLVAQRAELRPDTNLAILDDVHVSAMDPDQARSFDVRCNRGELDVETNDFLAEGDVHGTTGDGQRYRTAWVRYDHERGLLYHGRSGRDGRWVRVRSAAMASAMTRGSEAFACSAT